MVTGYIVHAFYQTVRTRTRLFLVGRLENRRTFAVIEQRARPSTFVRVSDQELVRSIPNLPSFEPSENELATMDGERVTRISFGSIQMQQAAAQALSHGGIRTYEGDLRFYDQYFIDNGIRASITIEGQSTRGKHVDHVFVNPTLRPFDWMPQLSVLSVDIENNPYSGEILSVSLCGASPWESSRYEQVLFNGTLPGLDDVSSFPNERAVLEAFAEALCRFDPDIVTGWNVIEYDFMHLSDRFKVHGLPFLIGRSDQAAEYLRGGPGQSSAVVIPGRQVIDSMRVMRSSPLRFEDNSLETVSREVLGEGKVKLDPEERPRGGNAKIRAILDAYQHNPQAFCRYSMEDARLVLDILDTTGMLELTVRRAYLTGVGLARAWTSVAAFEFLYMSEMRARGLVAPTKGVDNHPVGEAPGGAILPPKPGVFDNVLVFDFRSLYPSIIRTFNIDPVSFVSRHANLSGLSPADLLKAPNGAYFRRQEGILPSILDRFFRSRAEAKARHDETASYVYKIIMNSFYGVLGTPGCRFAASDIAGAITGFGQHLLAWCRDEIEALGFQVIYGDTDSVFVLSGLDPEAPRSRLKETGEQLARTVNNSLTRYVRTTWSVESHLELEFESLYLRFFLPAMRAHGTGELRGRAKGYAGMKLPADADSAEEPLLDVKGMEAIRRDWTDAAHALQLELLAMVFDRKPYQEVAERVRRFVQRVRNGELDRMLVYRKALRKPVRSYVRNRPPHVRAALLLEEGQRHGLIEYIWTVDGPQPVEARSAAIDYEHYVEKQLKPIAAGIGNVTRMELETLFDRSAQSKLF